MRENTISPEIGRQLVGDDDALVSAAKLIRCEHDGKTLFGGLTKGNLTKDKDWTLSIGTLIWVPCKDFGWEQDMCGWTIEDLLRDGLHPKYWKPKN